MRTPPTPSGRREPARNQYSGSGWGAVLFWILVGTAAVAASAATFLLVSAPIDLVRERIAEQVKARTGRELTVAGATSFSLLPTFSVSIGGVSLSPPPGMSGAPVFRVDSVEARVPLLPLLMRDVQLERIVLKGPEIELRVDAQGRRSWDFKQAEERPSSARPGEAKVADPARQTALDRLSRAELRIEGGQLRYIDERKNTQEQVSDIDLRFALERADAPLTVVGSAVWRGEPLAIEARLESPKDALGREPLQIAANIRGRPFEIAYDGSVTVRGEAELDGAVSVKSSSIRELARLLRTTLPEAIGLGPFALTGALRARESTVQLANLDMAVGEAKAVGAMTLERRDGRPHIVADLQAEELNLNAILRDGNGKGGAAAQSDGRPPRSQVRGFTARDGWGENEINLSSLGLADADLKLAVGRVLVSDIRTGRTTLTASLANRVLKATFDDMELYEGRGQGTVSLDATAPEAAGVQASFVLDNVSALPLLKDASQFDWIEGRGRVSLAVAGRGRTERQIVESLGGKAEFAFRDGAVVGINVAHMLRSLQQGRIPSLDRSPSEKTDFTELSASFRIENGIARNDDLKVLSPLLRVSGSGSADLPRRQIDYTARPKLVAALSGQGGAQSVSGVEIPLKITGSWSSPRVNPDIGGVLKDPTVVETAREIRKEFKGKSVGEALRGLLGDGSGQDGGGSGSKAKDLLKQLLKPNQAEKP